MSQVSSASNDTTTSMPRRDAARLLAEAKTALDSFIDSGDAVRLVRTIPWRSQAATLPISSSSDSNPPFSKPPQTLFILDSSFNPPQIAHMALATSALQSPDTHRYPKPHRLLLLFSTHNADKAGGSPAVFEHRLAMMILFAEDLIARLRSSISTSSTQAKTEEKDSVDIDVGLTNKPYYNDKSAAIWASHIYPTSPPHIHLTGFDTLTRIFTPKYYPNHTPPFSALAPFFAHHGLRVMIREDEEQGSDERGEWGDAEEQKRAVEKLGKGGWEKEGGQREWGKKVVWVDDEGEGKGVSSTRVRRAVEEGEWEEVQRLSTRQVKEWIREWGLYGEEKGKAGSKIV